MKVHCAKTCGMCNTDSHAPELEVGVTTTTTVTTVTSPPSPLTAAASKGTKGVRVSFASRCDASGVRADQQPDACPEPYVCVHTQEGPVCVCRNGQSCSLPAAGRATVTVPPVTATLMTTQAVVLPERPDTRRPSALVDGGCAGLETPCTTGFVCVSAAEVGPVCLCKSGQDTVCSNYHSAQAKARLAIAHTGAKAEQDQQQDQQAEAAPAPPETDAAAEGSRADSAVECTDNLKEGWCMVEWMSWYVSQYP